MTPIREALVLATLERYLSLLVNFAAMAAVSRILTPTEVGVAALGWAILAIPYALRDLGTMDFIVQRRDLSPGLIRTAATLCMLTSAAVTAAVLLVAPTLAWAFSDARVEHFLTVMVFAVLTDAVANPLLGLMRRDMEIRKVVLVNVTLAVVTAATSIGLALAGFSYMCVAWAGLIGNASAAALAVWLRPQLSVFRPNLVGWREVAGVGASFCSMAALLRAYEGMPLIALGRVMQPAAMGFYSRALQTTQLPEKAIMAGIASVAFPAFAVEAREGRSLKPSYLRAVELITAAQWPALLLVAVLAPRIVQVLFGDQWGEVVPLVQIMALASMLGVLWSMTYPVLYAIGDLRNAMLSTLLSLPISAALMVVAGSYGTLVLAASLFLTVPLNNAVGLYFINRHLAFSWAEAWTAIRKSLAVLALSALGPFAFYTAGGMTFELPLAAQAAMIVVTIALWVLGLRLTRHSLMAELELAAAGLRARNRTPHKPQVEIAPAPKTRPAL